jgi:voltage-gated potassium channel
MSTQDQNKLKLKLHEIIFEADTPTGRLFDIVLLISILASVAIVLMESVPTLNQRYGTLFYALEWLFTIIFTIEYILRIYVVARPTRYIFSFYGLVDLISILPTYLSFFIAGSQHLLVIRALRLLRLFRIFKLGSFLSQGRLIMTALKNSIPKIAVFLAFILVLVTIIGSIMHLIEAGVNHQFDSIPRSIYWAIVTLTTVGYGDITPNSNAGQFLSAIVMLLGYAILVVPTGIVSSEIIQQSRKMDHFHPSKTPLNTQVCTNCHHDEHDDDALYCKVCGERLNQDNGTETEAKVR